MSTKKNVYIFLGPPGSGKGTLSHLCVKLLGWVQLSTGNLCRKHISEQTEIGKQIDFAIKSGNLVSDSLINSMVQQWFCDTLAVSDNVILDGYPRTVMQAQALHQFLVPWQDRVSVKIIRFFVSDQAVVERIGSRLVCLNKDCQEVYSLRSGARIPARSMKCDVCSSSLGRRQDDDLAAIYDRLQTYHRHEQDLLTYYEKALFVIKHFVVEKPVEEVFEDFKKLVEQSA